jgi:hypothetical protein
VFVEIVTIGNVVYDPSQLGDVRVLFLESELGMWKEIVLIDKGAQSDCYNAFE